MRLSEFLGPDRIARLKNPRNYLGLAAAVLVALCSHYKLRIHLPANAYAGNDLPFQMTDVAREAGVAVKHEGAKLKKSLAAVEKFIASSSASVAVADYDNDGWPDFFVNDSNAGTKNHLFHNNHDGTFTDVAEQAGVANNEGINLGGAIFFDYDNDGNKDLLIINQHSPVLYRNNGDGTFTDVTRQMGLRKTQITAIPIAIDFDNDGYLDLIMAGSWPFGTDQIMPNSFLDASNGAPVVVYRNLKGKGFEVVPDSLGIDHTAFGRAIGVYDIRGTGRPDVWFANDFTTDKLYLNEGNGVFRNATQSIVKRSLSRNGMNAEFADLDNDGHPAVFVSQVYRRGQRIVGNTLWKWLGGETFQDIGRQRGVNACGWAWAGKFLDLDNDGHLDLVVGNGFISQNPNKDYWYFFNVTGGTDRQLMGDSKMWFPFGDSSLAGYQQACVFYNQGDGTFVDVAGATPLAGDLSDERGVAAIDFLNNGSQGLVITNQNQTLKLFRVDQKNNNRWIGFRLVGTKSNRDALGAEMKIALENGTVLSRQLQPMNTYMSQSDERLHFGLGANPKIKSVQLLWPSGLKQEFPGDRFALNQYHRIVEGEP